MSVCLFPMLEVSFDGLIPSSLVQQKSRDLSLYRFIPDDNHSLARQLNRRPCLFKPKPRTAFTFFLFFISRSSCDSCLLPLFSSSQFSFFPFTLKPFHFPSSSPFMAPKNTLHFASHCSRWVSLVLEVVQVLFRSAWLPCL